MFEIFKVVGTFVVGFGIGWGARVALDRRAVRKFQENAAKAFEENASDEELKEFADVLKKARGGK
jgi:hypothetical protein